VPPLIDTPTAFLRRVAATLMCLSGTGQIAALWFRALTGAAVADALSGAVYLIVGIGLLGQSRLSLFLGIVIPAVAIGLIQQISPEPMQAYRLHSAIDAFVIVFCAIALWRERRVDR